MEASEGGKLPIVVDTSPCLSQVKASISEPALRFALYEPVEFIRHFLVDKLEFSKVRKCGAVWRWALVLICAGIVWVACCGRRTCVGFACFALLAWLVLEALRP